MILSIILAAGFAGANKMIQADKVDVAIQPETAKKTGLMYLSDFLKITFDFTNP